jgi:hypothetical protein
MKKKRVNTMQQTMPGLIGVVILTTLASTGQAQFGPEGRYRPETVSALIERVHADLNRGNAVWHLGGGDRGLLTRAERQLHDFAEHWRHGKFDKGNLNRSIGDIQKVVEENHLSGRERDALWNDVEELRRMREAYDRHEIGSR